MDAITYGQAVKKISNYRKAGGKIGKMDLFDYSSILAVLFNTTKEETLDALSTAFEAQK